MPTYSNFDIAFIEKLQKPLYTLWPLTTSFQKVTFEIIFYIFLFQGNCVE